MLRPFSPTLADAPRISRSIQIRRPAIALYTAWHHLSQRPIVQLGDEGTWRSDAAATRIKAPCGHTTGPTFIDDHIHGLFIAWKSVSASGIVQSGEVWFHAGSSSAESTVSVLLSWHVDAATDLCALPGVHADVAQLDQDLHRFKGLMER